MSQFLHGVEVKEISDGLRPIRTVTSSVIGVVGTAPDADAEAIPLNVPTLITGPRMAAKLGDAGTLKDAYAAIYAQGVSTVIMVRVAHDDDPSATLAAVVGDETEQTGIWALPLAKSLTGLAPKILAAPGFTSVGADGDTASPAATSLIAAATRLRAVAIIDGPDSTEAAALTDRARLGSDRAYYVDPSVKVFDTAASEVQTRPASAYVAGALSASDAARGFWWSPSNTVIQGIVGTSRPIAFAMGKSETEANRLNAAEVATIIRQNGYRLWGNRTLSADPIWAFLSVRRTADMIYESIEEALLWAMDRPFSEQLLRDIRDSVQGYIDTLRARGAILGGKVWIDPELNTEATLKAGQLFLDFDIEPPAPLEHLTIRAHRNGTYYDELTKAVAS